MQRILSNAKVNQLRRILTDDKKRWKLTGIAYANKRNPKLPGVTLLRIAGTKAVLKIGMYENLSIANLLLIKKHHALAVKSGEIKAKHYSLIFPDILFQGRVVGQQASVTRFLDGVGCSELMAELDYQKQFPHRAITKNAEDFLKIHQGITYERLKSALSEVEADFTLLRAKGKTISEDFYGKNNLIVMGTNPNTGKIIFGVLDQLFKGEEMHHFEAFKKMRQQVVKN